MCSARKSHRRPRLWGGGGVLGSQLTRTSQQNRTSRRLARLPTGCVIWTNRCSLSLRGSDDPYVACLSEVLWGTGGQGPPLPRAPHAPACPAAPLTMSSLPFLCRALDSATVVSTQAAREQ